MSSVDPTIRCASSVVSMVDLDVWWFVKAVFSIQNSLSSQVLVFHIRRKYSEALNVNYTFITHYNLFSYFYGFSTLLIIIDNKIITFTIIPINSSNYYLFLVMNIKDAGYH